MNSQDVQLEKIQDSPFSRFLVCACLLVLTTWIPFGVLNSLLEEFQNLTHEFYHKKRVNQANKILAQMDRLLDTDQLVDRALFRFDKKWNGNTHSSLNSQNISEMEREFFKVFPKSSTLAWINEKGKIIKFTGDVVVSKFKRGWESFIQYLIDKKTSPLVNKMAERFCKLVMGEFLDSKLFRSKGDAPLTTYFQNELHYFQIVSFAGIGHVFIFIPKERARKGWQLDRTIKVLKKISTDFPLEFGGFWGSSDSYSKHCDINYNFMVGLRDDTVAGNNVRVQDDFLYRSRFFNKDPDLFLAVGVGKKHFRSWGENNEILILRKILQALTVFSTILVVAFFLSGRLYSMSLKSKFQLITFFLVSIPLIALAVLGFSNSIRMAVQYQQEIDNSLEQLIGNVGLAAAEEIGRLEWDFRKLSLLDELKSAGASQFLKDFFRLKSKDLGIGQIYFYNPNISKNPLTMGKDKNDPLVKLIAQRLEFGNSKVLKTDNMGEFADLVKMSNPAHFSAHLDRMHFFEIGPLKRFIFHTFIKDGQQKRLAYFYISARFEDFQNYLLQAARKKVLDTAKVSDLQIFLRPCNLSRKGREATAEMKEWQEILNLVELTGVGLKSSVRKGGTEFQVFAQPLKDLEAVGLVSIPEKGQHIPILFGIIFIIFTLVLAAGFGLFSSTWLNQYLLQPLFSLRDSVTEVDRGNYSVSAEAVALDELGDLSTGFNLLTEGLRQKERMAKFVRDDLLIEGESQEAGKVEIRDLVIMFAGIRDFAKLEPRLSPRAAMAIMSHFLGLCEENVRRAGGKIDKFIGDTAMAVFSDVEIMDASQFAVQAGINISKQMEVWNKEREKLDLPTVSIGIGISSGKVLAGHIGSIRKRLDFTVIGDTVNTAARIEKMAGKPDSGTILVSESVTEGLFRHFSVKETSLETIRGKKESIKIFAVYEK